MTKRETTMQIETSPVRVAHLGPGDCTRLLNLLDILWSHSGKMSPQSLPFYKDRVMDSTCESL